MIKRLLNYSFSVSYGTGDNLLRSALLPHSQVMFQKEVELHLIFRCLEFVRDVTTNSFDFLRLVFPNSHYTTVQTS